MDWMEDIFFFYCGLMWNARFFEDFCCSLRSKYTYFILHRMLSDLLYSLAAARGIRRRLLYEKDASYACVGASSLSSVQYAIWGLHMCMNTQQSGRIAMIKFLYCAQTDQNISPWVEVQCCIRIKACFIRIRAPGSRKARVAKRRDDCVIFTAEKV